MVCRSYCPHIHLNGRCLTISDPGEIHHIKNVLRLRVGDDLNVFDGKGSEYQGKVAQVSVQGIDLDVKNVRRNQRVRPVVILACAIPKKGKFEEIIEKATELGVDEIIPLVTQRTEVIFKEDSLERKMKRFESIAVSAAKQCQRSAIPVIHAPMKLKKALEYIKPRTMMVIRSLMGERRDLLRTMSILDFNKGVSFFIGPEGDFTLEEYQMAWNEGCVPVTLGETVLRVETAAISVVAAARFHFDYVLGERRS